jgi:hypothetical protein
VAPTAAATTASAVSTTWISSTLSFAVNYFIGCIRGIIVAHATVLWNATVSIVLQIIIDRCITAWNSTYRLSYDKE